MKFLHSGVVGVVIVAGLWTGCKDQPSDSGKNSVASSDTFTVAFYNVENLFDNEFDGKEYPEYRPNATNWNEEMHAKKLENIASVIAALNAPVIALCEVEDGDALAQLAAVLKKKGAPYPYRVIIDTPVISNTNTALLSRFPVKNVREHAVTLPDSLVTRGILEAELQINNKTLKLLVNHWPSKHHPEKYRRIAADTLLDIIATFPPRTDYVLLGDFNGDYDEFSTIRSSGQAASDGITGINHRLGTVTAVTPITTRLRTAEEFVNLPFPSHYDLWMELPDAVRMSYVYQGNRQTPDHIILPPSLFDSLGIAYVDKSFNSFTWGSRLLEYGRPLGWKMRYQGKQKFHTGEGFSDHLPIKATFTLGRFSINTSEIDFYDAFAPDSSNPDSWFEFHSSGWVACENGVNVQRDTVAPAAGNFAFHVVAIPKKDNYTAVRAVVPGAYRNKSGDLYFYLRGKGDLCIRSLNKAKKWRYFNVNSGKESGRAEYQMFNSDIWQTITLPSDLPSGSSLEVELRSGKQAPLDVWIDR